MLFPSFPDGEGFFAFFDVALDQSGAQALLSYLKDGHFLDDKVLTALPDVAYGKHEHNSASYHIRLHSSAAACVNRRLT
jgi:hypothetical protein